MQLKFGEGGTGLVKAAQRLVSLSLVSLSLSGHVPLPQELAEALVGEGAANAIDELLRASLLRRESRAVELHPLAPKDPGGNALRA